MNRNEITSQVDTERIYQHVLKTEGIRHPIDAPAKLNETADYILSEFERYGLQARDRRFEVEDFDMPFRNIVGVLGEGNSPEFLIVSHYDTVHNSPGANDNGSGVAVMLETARVLAQAKEDCNVRFISFTLEEGNPTYALKARQMAQRLRLRDKRLRYTTHHTHKLMKEFNGHVMKAWTSGKKHTEAFAEALSRLEDQLKEPEAKYLEGLEKMYRGITATSWPGKTGLIGSGFWVEETQQTTTELLGVLCLETIGYTSNKKNSQSLPEGMDPTIFQVHNVTDTTIGNFIAVIGEVNSDKLAQSFCSHCTLDSVNLPYASLQIPLRFEEIAQLGFRDLLRSDHTPFWRAGIPALLLTDTANFRYPFYHTQADTIDKLDFDFITKVCKATIATACTTFDYALNFKS